MLKHRKKVTEAERSQERGIYTCTQCGNSLFEASKKFEVGSGFPSFWAQIKDHVLQQPLSTYGRHRVQLLCSRCGQHLGHLFDDARTPTQVRYCISNEALSFEE